MSENETINQRNQAEVTRKILEAAGFDFKFECIPEKERVYVIVTRNTEPVIVDYYDVNSITIMEDVYRECLKLIDNE